MKKSKLFVTRYQLSDGFIVDVIPRGDEVAFWLGHQSCDVRELMFAASATLVPEERWEEMLADNLDDYLDDFREAWLEE